MQVAARRTHAVDTVQHRRPARGAKLRRAAKGVAQRGGLAILVTRMLARDSLGRWALATRQHAAQLEKWERKSLRARLKAVATGPLQGVAAGGSVVARQAFTHSLTFG